MQSRILELKNKTLDEHFSYTWSTMDYDDVTKFAEKFAELIVKECVEIAFEQKKWVEDQVVFNPRDKEWNLARIQQSQRIVDKIKEHFEVE